MTTRLTAPNWTVLLTGWLAIILMAGLVSADDKESATRTSGKTGRAGAIPRAEIQKQIGAELQHLESLYKHFHTHPELSLHEQQTSARLAAELKALGFTVTEKVGGYGVVGVLKNGPGPTVLVRTDMDALPVTERTGLPYASKQHVRDKSGNDVGVMHACGHDMQMRFSFRLVATAPRILVSAGLSS